MGRYVGCFAASECVEKLCEVGTLLARHLRGGHKWHANNFRAVAKCKYVWVLEDASL